MSDSYRDLVAWQKAMGLVTEVYRVTEQFPNREIYGLTRQVRDAAVSVPSNIAEGKGRQTKRDYLQFLYRARGSLLEAETQLEVGRNLGFLSQAVFETIYGQAAEVGRVLSGLIRKVQQQINESPKS
jgi:four helix bundle protein